jgi:hypothetical protein
MAQTPECSWYFYWYCTNAILLLKRKITNLKVAKINDYINQCSVHFDSSSRTISRASEEAE